MTDEAWAASPTTAKRWLGRQMRAHREAAGLGVKDAADALRATLRKVGYTEAGERTFKPRDLEEVLLPLYEVPEGDWPALLAACRRSRERGWWQSYDDDVVPPWVRTYIGLEQGAVTLRSWEALYPHGLLQAEAYTRALTTSRWALPDEDVPARVELRVQRQEALTRPVGPLEAHFILDEAVLRRVVGGADVMSAQMAHLVEVAGWPNVTLQVVPYARGPHPAVAASFTVLGFGAGDAGVAYLESGTRGEYVEDPHEVGDYEVAFDQLAELALSPPESITYIKEIFPPR